MRISIALCTYNGERYLPEQLQSIAGQTRQPDELVVCDDCSQDGTVEILREFAERAAFPVRLILNEENLGSTRNFAKAIGLCSGDVIALSDQDDVWLPDKLARMERNFAADPKLGLLFTDAVMADEHLQPLGYNLWKPMGFSRRLQRQALRGGLFKMLARQNYVTGATMAFRARYSELFNPIPESWVHDAWIALLLSAVAGSTLDTKPLILYRQHPKQQIGIRRESKASILWRLLCGRGRYREVLYAAYTHTVARYGCALERLESVGGRDAAGGALAILAAKIDHMTVRTTLPRKSKLARLPAMGAELLRGRYHRYANGFKDLTFDLLM